jgi:hypothetical protein
MRKKRTKNLKTGGVVNINFIPLGVHSSRIHRLNGRGDKTQAQKNFLTQHRMVEIGTVEGEEEE